MAAPLMVEGVTRGPIRVEAERGGLQTILGHAHGGAARSVRVIVGATRAALGLVGVRVRVRARVRDRVKDRVRVKVRVRVGVGFRARVG